jgi:hypothetical protein
MFNSCYSGLISIRLSGQLVMRWIIKVLLWSLVSSQLCVFMCVERMWRKRGFVAWTVGWQEDEEEWPRKLQLSRRQRGVWVTRWSNRTRKFLSQLVKIYWRCGGRNRREMRKAICHTPYIYFRHQPTQRPTLPVHSHLSSHSQPPPSRPDKTMEKHHRLSLITSYPYSPSSTTCPQFLILTILTFLDLIRLLVLCWTHTNQTTQGYKHTKASPESDPDLSLALLISHFLHYTQTAP